MASNTGSTAGKGNKMGSADYANVALGVASLIKGATTKKPKRYQATQYNASIRPAQGNEESLKRVKNDIAEQAASATNDVTAMAGSDVSAGLLARLGIQSNATKAIANAESENAKVYREDLNRVSQEKNQESMFNTQSKNDQNFYNSQIDQANYAANKNAAAAGVQSALQYEANRQADIKNKYVQQESSNQMVDAVDKTLWNDAYNTAIKNRYTPDKAKEYADNIMKERNVGSLKSDFYSRPGTFGRARK